MENKPTVTEETLVNSVRNAIKTRATWFVLLYKSFAKALPPEQVEKLAREAIYSITAQHLH